MTTPYKYLVKELSKPYESIVRINIQCCVAEYGQLLDILTENDELADIETFDELFEAFCDLYQTEVECGFYSHNILTTEEDYKQNYEGYIHKDTLKQYLWHKLKWDTDTDKNSDNLDELSIEICKFGSIYFISTGFSG